MSSSLKVTRRFTLGGKRENASSPALPSARPLIAPAVPNSSRNSVSTHSAAAAASFDLSPVPPARLEGTSASFPLSANRLITLAQELFATDTGVAEGSEDLLAGKKRKCFFSGFFFWRKTNKKEKNSTPSRLLLPQNNPTNEQTTSASSSPSSPSRKTGAR